MAVLEWAVEDDTYVRRVLNGRDMCRTTVASY